MFFILLLLWCSSQGQDIVSGYPARCFLHAAAVQCSSDVSCFWCRDVQQCYPRPPIFNGTLDLVANCAETLASSSCTQIVCTECSDEQCLYKRCGYAFGGTTPLNNTEENCQVQSEPCYYCTYSNGTGNCFDKITDCDETINDNFGVCISIDCSNGDPYDGALLTESEKDAIIIVRMVTSFFSLFGCLIMIFSIMFLWQIRFLSARIILCLTLSNLIEAIANIMSLGIYERELVNYQACQAQGNLIQFGSIAAFGWILVIAIDLLLVVNLIGFSGIKELFYHVLVWALAGAALALPWTTNSYGIAGLWCWLTWSKGQAWRWIAYYVPLFIVIIAITLIYLYLAYVVIRKARGPVSTESEKDTAKALLLKLAAYPIIFWFCYIFSIINRIYDVASPNESFALFLLESLTTPLVGFLNCLAYFAGRDVRMQWKHKLFKHGCCLSCTTPAAGVDDYEDFEDEVTFY